MKRLLITFLVCLNVALSYQKTVPRHLTDKFIESINSKKSTWQAGKNFGLYKAFSKLNGVARARSRLPLKVHQIKQEEIPESFDARNAWPECADIIGLIHDEADCGACWAFGAVKAMSDRICIHSQGKDKVVLSAEDLTNCCPNCGRGCKGDGLPEEAWPYWVNTGIVSGGPYGSKTGCKSYSHAPCDHYINGSYQSQCGERVETPKCEKQCDASVNLNYTQELRRGSSAYSLPQDEAQIQTEIMTNGPLEADYVIYEDFLTYKSGVYQHVEGERVVGHAIKLIGWGVENGTPYWLASNSWNEDWGDKGYFKILRGSNECNIEGYVNSGMP